MSFRGGLFVNLKIKVYDYKIKKNFNRKLL
jgi:hypothetical protein